MPDISSRSGVRITYFMAKQANEPKHPENASPRKKITGLIVVLVMLAVLVMLVSGPLAYRCVIRHNLSGANACVAVSPETPTPEPTEAPTPASAPEPQYPVYREGRAVASADELSLYDVVTYGSYPQTSGGVEEPIRWYVVGKEDDKVTLLSVYALDSRKFHNRNEEVTFRSSDIYRWLNGDFRDKAFSYDELMMQDSPVLLMSKDDAMKLPMNYRTTSSTEYAISQGADAKRCLWWVGDFSKVYEFTDYNDGVADTSLANAAYCMNNEGEIWTFQVNFSGKAVRPMVIVQF